MPDKVQFQLGEKVENKGISNDILYSESPATFFFLCMAIFQY